MILDKNVRQRRWGQSERGDDGGKGGQRRMDGWRGCRRRMDGDGLEKLDGGGLVTVR